MIRKILPIIGFLLLNYLSDAQISVSATLDSTYMLIGDQMKLHLTAKHNSDTKILKVDLSKLEEVKEIEIVETGQWDTLQNGLEFTLKQDLTFTVFDSGAYFIPVIPFVYQQNGQTRTANTNELLIEVQVPLADTVALAPIKPIILEPFKFEDVLPYIYSILGIAALAGLGFFFYRRSKQKEIPPPPAIIIPAHEIAFKKLTELKNAKLWQQGKIKEYQSRLTFIVREYLENRYGTQALESTTNQILKQLEPIHFSKDWKQKLREMLELADLVKFAKAEPPIEAHDRLMGYAEDFVNSTKQIVLEKTENENIEENTEA